MQNRRSKLTNLGASLIRFYQFSLYVNDVKKYIKNPRFFQAAFQIDQSRD